MSSETSNRYFMVLDGHLLVFLFSFGKYFNHIQLFVNVIQTWVMWLRTQLICCNHGQIFILELIIVGWIQSLCIKFKRFVNVYFGKSSVFKVWLRRCGSRDSGWPIPLIKKHLCVAHVSEVSRFPLSRDPGFFFSSMCTTDLNKSLYGLK